MEKKTTKRKPKLTIIESTNVKQILSPLEERVLFGKPNPFIYDFEGRSIYVSRYMAKELLGCIRRKIELIKHAQEKDLDLAKVPFKYREALDNPKIVLSLTPLLRNRLCKLELYSLYKIMKKGRKYFEEELNFSKKYMATLDGLFAYYKCGDLF